MTSTLCILQLKDCVHLCKTRSFCHFTFCAKEPMICASHHPDADVLYFNHEEETQNLQRMKKPKVLEVTH
jgi:hypothetical protein